MGQISLQIPQSGQPFSTEGPKVASDMTTIQTAINGNLDDSNLLSPNGAVRRCLLSGSLIVGAGTNAAHYLFPNGGTSLISTGVNLVGINPPLIWAGDAGLSSQPQDFQVANKSALMRVRGSVLVNATAPAVTITLGLYQITASGGAAGVLTLTFGSAVASSTAAITTPAGSSTTSAESTQFTLPSSGIYALGYNLSGTVAANSDLLIAGQLYAYNA